MSARPDPPGRTARAARPVRAVTVVLVLLLAGLVLAAPGAGARPVETRQRLRTATSQDATPLQIQLTSLTPSQIPRRGTITITGTVTNVSTETWQDVNVLPFVGETPITSRESLAEAAQTDPATEVGARLYRDGLYATLGDVAVGQSVDFSIQLPRAALPIDNQPGVYWIGVHALGTDRDGRDTVADGRARTFIPLLPEKARTLTPVPVSMVLPLRARATRSSDGRLDDSTRFVGLLRGDGRLRRVTGLLADAGTRPVTVDYDPAVLDAAASVAAGNPALRFERRPRQPSASASASSDPSPSGSGSPSPSAEPDADDPATAVAAQWLRQTVGLLRGQTGLATPYGDPDVMALARTSPRLLTEAEAVAQSSLTARGLRAPGVVAPPGGLADTTLLDRVSRTSLLLLSDQALEHEHGAYALRSGQQLVLSDERVGDGGPGPTPPLDALALRQRIVSDAALAALGDDRTPIVVALPPSWDPGPAWQDADLWGGLDVPWIRLSPLPGPGTDGLPTTLPYPASARAAEVPAATVRAAGRFLGEVGLLASLLTTATTGVTTLQGMAFQSVSYGARRRPVLARQSLDEDLAATRATLDRVGVEGTDFVTLSGGSGTLTVSLVNELDHAVTVGLRARTDNPQVRVVMPVGATQLGPRQRMTVRLRVSSGAPGVHRVTLVPVTAQGRAAGKALRFNLRTSQVGLMIWIIMAAAGVLLVVMIVRRVVRRIRTHSWDIDAEQDDAGGVAEDPRDYGRGAAR